MKMCVKYIGTAQTKYPGKDDFSYLCINLLKEK